MTDEFKPLFDEESDEILENDFPIKFVKDKFCIKFKGEHDLIVPNYLVHTKKDRQKFNFIHRKTHEYFVNKRKNKEKK